jgi:uncharacterized protein
VAARHIGLISDTHGLLRPAVREAFAGVELILHAGDVGGAEIIAELETIAPVRAVAGNCDDPFADGLPLSLDLVIDGVRIHVSHGHELGVPLPAKLLERYAADVIVYGHTHKQLVEQHGTRIVVNPGAAGPRRFNMLPSVGRLTIEAAVPHVTLVSLPS